MPEQTTLPEPGRTVLRAFATLASPNRRAGQNGGATCRLRLDEQLATYQLQTFLHAGQAESQASTRRIDVEANAFITNGEMDGVPGSAKMHIEMPGPAVSHRVVQGFLEDPEETERHVRRDTPGTFSSRKSISTFFCPESSSQKPRIAATTPRCSSRGGCSSCDSACTSAMISAVCF